MDAGYTWITRDYSLGIELRLSGTEGRQELNFRLETGVARRWPVKRIEFFD
jgi:hypothetical protein